MLALSPWREFPEFFARLAHLNLVVRTFASPKAKVGTDNSKGSWAGTHQLPRRENSPTGDPSPALEKILPLPGGEGRGALPFS